MNLSGRILSIVVVHAALLSDGYGQGNFINLDFELANVPDIPAGQYGADVSSTDGVPGWTTYIGTNQGTTIRHNISLP